MLSRLSSKSLAPGKALAANNSICLACSKPTAPDATNGPMACKNCTVAVKNSVRLFCSVALSIALDSSVSTDMRYERSRSSCITATTSGEISMPVMRESSDGSRFSTINSAFSSRIWSRNCSTRRCRLTRRMAPNWPLMRCAVAVSRLAD